MCYTDAICPPKFSYRKYGRHIKWGRFFETPYMFNIRKSGGMKILKWNGKRVDYEPSKIRRSLKRAGAKPDVIDHVLKKVRKHLKTNMTTKEVYAFVKMALKEENAHIAHRYDLRRALGKLGPAGFKFEKYVASILAAYDYDTEIPPKEFKGKCIYHEVDVVAKKGAKTIMIEAKFRNDFRDYVKLKDTMATWARYEDLVEGNQIHPSKTPRFDEVWIVSNGNISRRSRKWGVCKGMRIIGWHYPEKNNLAQMVDKSALYPITALDNISRRELDAFSDHGLMLCREVADSDSEKLAHTLGLNPKRASNIVSTCKAVVGHEG